MNEYYENIDNFYCDIFEIVLTKLQKNCFEILEFLKIRILKFDVHYLLLIFVYYKNSLKNLRIFLITFLRINKTFN